MKSSPVIRYRESALAGSVLPTNPLDPVKNRIRGENIRLNGAKYLLFPNDEVRIRSTVDRAKDALQTRTRGPEPGALAFRCYRSMESFLHRLLNMRSDFPIWLRYILSFGLVAIAFFGKLLLDERLGAYPFLLFIPAILLASVLFNRGSGILATMAAAVLAIRHLLPGPVSSAPLPLILFVITGLCIAGVTELLRTTLRNLADAKRYTEVLLQELAHRTRNDLATIVSILRLQARSETNPAVQAAIASAVARVDVVAKVHDRLRHTADSSRIDLAPYIQSLCSSLADFHRGVRTISIGVRCETVQVRTSQAASIGLIVNELVTNCFKYAYPDGRSGAVEVDVRAKEDRILVSVRDDGVGCPAEIKSGLGTRLINLLTTQMKGTMTRNPLPQGCEVQIAIERDA